MFWQRFKISLINHLIGNYPCFWSDLLGNLINNFRNPHHSLRFDMIALKWAMIYWISWKLWGIDAVHELVQLAHQRVHLVSHPFCCGEWYVLVLEFGRHLFLNEFQSIVNKFYFFRYSKWKSRFHSSWLLWVSDTCWDVLTLLNSQ
jgi:hypothetical protein